MQIDEKALAAAIEATRRAGQRGDLTSSPVSRVVMEAAILAYESAKPKEAEGWQDIASAPLNQSVQIFIPGAGYYGNRGVYAGILVDMGSGRRWMTFGWAIGRDLGTEMQPTAWRPLPEPPSAMLSAAGEVNG